MMAKNPSAIFYWNDWENDPELKTCSLAAQGLWMRMLCIAARSPEPGFVLMRGQPEAGPDFIAALSRQVGYNAETLIPLIHELLASGAASVDRTKRIYCRRMRRAAATSKKRSESGKIGASVTNGKYWEKEDLPRQKRGKVVGKPVGSSILQSSNNTLGHHHDPPSQQKAESDGFEDWWKIYPHKVAKPAALRAYRSALKKIDHSSLMSRTHLAAPGIAEKEKKWRPHPATWLNQERWNDVPEEDRSTPRDPEHERWRSRAEYFYATGFWLPEYGPKPGDAGCVMPEEFIQQMNGRAA